MKIEGAGIEEIPCRSRASESFDPVPGAKRLLNYDRLPRIVVDIRPQSSARRNYLAARFHLLDVDFVATAPGRHERIFTQRFGQIDTIRCEQPGDVIRPAPAACSIPNASPPSAVHAARAQIPAAKRKLGRRRMPPKRIAIATTTAHNTGRWAIA
jgi:hypothetical protein